ncbi:MAG: metallophosphoesterase [Victivallales bacterium]|nr:metallophosphoesterase [Victivallales bacterium]
MLKKLSFLFFCMELVFAGFQLYAAQVVVLNTCDLHGHCRRFLKLCSLITAEKQSLPPDAILLIDCGDTIQGTYESMFYHGRLIIDGLNYSGYDAWITGNHDFDYGLPQLQQRMRQFTGAVLAANLDYPGFGKLCNGWKLFKKGGVSVALIGMTAPGMGKSLLVPGWKFDTGSFENGMERVMTAVRAAHPEIIILAMHSGLYGSNGFSAHQFAARYPEIDLVLGSHTHVKESGCKIGPDTWYFQAGKHGEGLGKITIDFDEKSRKIRKISSLLLPVTKATPECPELAKRFAPFLKKAGENGEKQIATIIFENGKDVDSGFTEQRIIGRMMLALTGADVAVGNTYPTRYQLHGKVAITLKRLYYWARFDDTVCTLELDCETWRRILAEQQELLKKNYRTIITYADRKSFTGKSRIKAAFSSYALAGAGGRFPLLRREAQKKERRLNNTGILIRKGLQNYLTGKNEIFQTGNETGAETKNRKR